MLKRFPARWALTTAAVLAAFGVSAVHGAPLPEGSAVTAQLSSGPASGLLSLADLYASSANPAAATVSSAVGDIEFLTDDAALGLDWTSDGVLTVWNNLGSALAADYTFRLGFSGHLAGVTDYLGKGLSVSQDGDVLTVTVLSGAFQADFGAVQAVAVEVPEPAGWALALTGLLAAAATRRRAGR